VRRMVKALLVAVATGLGSQAGGWVGGVIVFVLSAGLSAYYEIPDAAHSQPEPHH
jgi:hypothetical protein